MVGFARQIAADQPHQRELHALLLYVRSRLAAHAAVAAVSGGVGAPRGTLYGVYALAEALGVRYLAHDETVLPPCPAQLPTLDIVESAPSFEYRDDNQFQVSSYQGWATKRGFNGPSSAQPAALGGHLRYATPPGGVHTSYALLSGAPRKPGERDIPPPKLRAAHPEWFWPPAAPKTPPSTASSAGRTRRSWQFVTAQARKILRAQPDARILSISQNDNYNQCMSAAEQAINNEEGSPIGALLTAVNTIAAALEGEFPDVAFDTLAYQWTRPAPTSLRPRPNVIIRLCTIEADFARPLTHPNNAPFKRTWRRGRS